MSYPQRAVSANRIGTNIRFDADLHERLVAEADQRCVSVTWLVNRLIRESIDRLIPVSEYRLTRPPKETEPDG